MNKTKSDLAVVYRIYPMISREPLIFEEDKYQLVKFCLNSFKKSLGTLKVKIWFLLDSCPPEYELLVKNYFNEEDLEILNLNKYGNEATFKLQIDILLNQECSEYIYFAEDDYYYFPNQFEKMLSFLKKMKNVDFITPFDHLDYYSTKLHDYRRRYQNYKSINWKTVGSTCLTFLTTKETLNYTREIFDLYSTQKATDASVFFCLTKIGVFNPFRIIRFLLRDIGNFSIYYRAWRYGWRYILLKKRKNLWVPYPTIATHLQKDGLPPYYNWEDIFRDVLNKIETN